MQSEMKILLNLISIFKRQQISTLVKKGFTDYKQNVA